MMRPLQLWLPLLHLTASTPAMQRDQQRAFEVWRGEHTVWLVPGLQEACRWTEGLGPYDWRVAVPAEELECINVYHVDRHARVYGYRSMSRFPGSKVTGMLQDWLNSACNVVWAPRLPELRLRIPTFADGMVTYTERPICLTPDPRVPLSLDAERHRVVIEWAPTGAPTPIAPTTENQERYGPVTGSHAGGMSFGAPASGFSPGCLDLAILWPQRLRWLSTPGNTLDILYQRCRMKQVARQSQGDTQGALFQAKQQAKEYVSEGWTSNMLAEFFPARAVDGIQTAFQEVTRKVGRDSKSWETVFQTRVGQRWGDKHLPIRRAWGAIGLFWALLLDQLENNHPYRECQDCHRLNQGKKGKRYCGPDDDKLCYDRRRARDKHNERAR